MAVTAVMFSPTRLIKEVKLRPKLYDTELSADRSQKLELWKEVCAAIFDDWEACNKATVYDRVLAIQKKWRSLRDAYNRELRMRRQGDRNGRREYRYFKKMSFLGGFEGTVSPEPDDDSDEEPDSYLFPGGELDGDPRASDETVPVKVKKFKKKKRKRQDSDYSEEVRQESEDIQDDMQDEIEMPMFPVEMTEAESDSDRFFLLSFVPEMRQLPVNIKMWARAQIANIMQEAVNSQFDTTKVRGAVDVMKNVRQESSE